MHVLVCGGRTEQQRGDEGGRHAGGTQQHGVAQPEASLWDPAEDHGRNGGQEAHHRGLDLSTYTTKTVTSSCR